jgi:hypothetical protein
MSRVARWVRWDETVEHAFIWIIDESNDPAIEPRNQKVRSTLSTDLESVGQHANANLCVLMLDDEVAYRFIGWLAWDGSP